MLLARLRPCNGSCPFFRLTTSTDVRAIEKSTSQKSSPRARARSVLWIDVPTWDGKWRCARLPPRLGQRNEPFRKISAGACTASEGDLAAESRPAPHRVSASADFHLLVLTMRSPDSAPCLGLGDETHPFASSPQVLSWPLRVTWLRRTPAASSSLLLLMCPTGVLEVARITCLALYTRARSRVHVCVVQLCCVKLSETHADRAQEVESTTRIRTQHAVSLRGNSPRCNSRFLDSPGNGVVWG